MTVVVVLTNLPDRESAERMAGELVEAGVAACVNVFAPCRSVYRWKGAVQREEECPLLIKTTEARYPALEAAIVSRHPYELPEIVAVPVSFGLQKYVDWVKEEVAE